MYIHSCDVYIVGNIAKDLQDYTYSLCIGFVRRASMNVIGIDCVNLLPSCSTFVK